MTEGFVAGVIICGGLLIAWVCAVLIFNLSSQIIGSCDRFDLMGRHYKK